MNPTTQEIEQWIAEHGSTRDALNVALARLEVSNEDAEKFIDGMWRDIIIKHKPDYGDWEYPVQAHRHLVAEFDDLRQKNAALEADMDAIRKAAEAALELCAAFPLHEMDTITAWTETQIAGLHDELKAALRSTAQPEPEPEPRFRRIGKTMVIDFKRRHLMAYDPEKHGELENEGLYDEPMGFTLID